VEHCIASNNVLMLKLTVSSYSYVQGKPKTAHKQRPSRTYKCRQRTMHMTHLWKKWRDCCSHRDFCWSLCSWWLCVHVT